MRSPSLPRRLARVVTAAVLASLPLLSPAVAEAASLTVVVRGADGQPAPNVVVQAMPSRPVPIVPSATPVVVTQKDIRFVPWVTAVPVGTTVRFTNADHFDHHLRSQAGGPLGNVPPAQDFEFRLAGAKADLTASAEVRLHTAGTIVLGCHLHNSMRGHVFVSSTPFVAVTDATGRVVLDGLPDGPATVKVWHPEQFSDQPDLPAHVGTTVTAPVAATLNFTPRRRPASLAMPATATASSSSSAGSRP